ncbi:hypothetical protein IGS67_12395 [Flavimobilis sp. GY10621]|uniref:Zinc-ribbon domain-containing protein n=1 Tax=Flavimobilis rhizosphaerae TaxID=2775421 RepID=A0ABR9DT15_9MICO|nr:hypothetical protein [Flavimobilis rhizosphaerae]MBD9700278.1 hypothetical protein [Flavimobilis rhizosphaerae]
MSAEQPILSPDGTMRWDGQKWVPYAGATSYATGPVPGAPAVAPAAVPPHASGPTTSRSGQSLFGLVLCLAAGAVFVYFSSLDEALSFFMFPALLCGIGAVLFGARLATQVQCNACKANVPKTARVCGRCGAAL